MVEGDLGREDCIGQGLGGALGVFVPPAVLVFQVGAWGVVVEALFMVRRIELTDKAWIDWTIHLADGLSLAIH
jgi:hypothetical protein